MFSPRHTLATGVFILVLSHLISSNAAGFGGPCSTGSHRTLNDGCSISDDCSTITCKMDFVYEPITFKLEINKCDDPVSVTASMDVPDLSITWSHTYTDDDIVEVPGFNASLPAVVSAGVYVQVELTANDDELHLTVKLLAGGEILGKSVYPVKTTVMDGDLPMNTKACGAFAWWYEMNDVSKVALIAGLILVIIFMMMCCCCCCCKTRVTTRLHYVKIR
ncbi:uncharacterized protein LOC144664435 [Oculina patagonica]